MLPLTCCCLFSISFAGAHIVSATGARQKTTLTSSRLRALGDNVQCWWCKAPLDAGEELCLKGERYDRRLHVALPGSEDDDDHNNKDGVVIHMDHDCANKADVYQQLCHYPHNLLLRIREDVRFFCRAWWCRVFLCKRDEEAR